jgi:hypothetical protein
VSANFKKNILWGWIPISVDKKHNQPHFRSQCRISNLRAIGSVADPDPNPDPDPHVFRPPGSGSTSQRYGSGSISCSGSGSFYHHAKILRKTLITHYFVTLLDFLSLKNYVNVASKSNKQKKIVLKN